MSRKTFYIFHFLATCANLKYDVINPPALGAANQRNSQTFHSNEIDLLMHKFAFLLLPFHRVPWYEQEANDFGKIAERLKDCKQEGSEFVASAKQGKTIC